MTVGHYLWGIDTDSGLWWHHRLWCHRRTLPMRNWYLMCRRLNFIRNSSSSDITYEELIQFSAAAISLARDFKKVGHYLWGIDTSQNPHISSHRHHRRWLVGHYLWGIDTYRCDDDLCLFCSVKHLQVGHYLWGIDTFYSNTKLQSH